MGKMEVKSEKSEKVACFLSLPFIYYFIWRKDKMNVLTYKKIEIIIRGEIGEH